MLTEPKPHRDRVKSVRFTAGEWTAVELRAAEARMSPSRFVREAALGTRLNGRVDREAIRQLSRVGNNLNQIAHLANATRKIELSGRVERVLDRLLVALERFG